MHFLIINESQSMLNNQCLIICCHMMSMLRVLREIQIGVMNQYGENYWEYCCLFCLTSLDDGSACQVCAMLITVGSKVV